VQSRKEFAEDALSRLTDEGDAISRLQGCLGTDPALFD